MKHPCPWRTVLVPDILPPSRISPLQLRFSLVHRLAKASTKPGAMWVGQLKGEADGLFRWERLGSGRAAPCPAAARPVACLASTQPKFSPRLPPWRRRPQASAPKLLTLGTQFPRAVRVRTEWVQPQGKRRGGWALKTKEERILM